MRIFLYIFSFGLGRGALFAAPLFLANFLVPEEYGLFETSLAVASVLASLSTLGTSSVIPLVLLRDSPNASLGGVFFQHILVVAVCICFVVAAVFFQWPLIWQLTAFLTASLVMQGLLSTHLKTLGKGDASVLIDSGLLFFISFAVVLSSVAHFNALYSVWLTSLVYCLSIVFLYFRFFFRVDRCSNGVAWFSTLKVGIPLMLGGLISLLATTSGRLGMGLLANSHLTADYSVLARACALPIVAHQLILVARFRRLFADRDQIVSRTMLQVVFFVAVSVLCFLLLSPWFGFLLGPAFLQKLGKFKISAFLIAVQAILWSGIALNDLVITRHQVMQKVLPYNFFSLLFAILVGWFLIRWVGLTLYVFVLVHSGVMLFFYLAQSSAMSFFGLRYFRVWLVTCFSYVFLVGLCFMISKN